MLLGHHADDVSQPMARVSLALGGDSEPFNVDMMLSDVQDLLGSLKEASSVLELMLEEEKVVRPSLFQTRTNHLNNYSIAPQISPTILLGLNSRVNNRVDRCASVCVV